MTVENTGVKRSVVAMAGKLSALTKGRVETCCCGGGGNNGRSFPGGEARKTQGRVRGEPDGPSEGLSEVKTPGF